MKAQRLVGLAVLVAACGGAPISHRVWWAPDGASFEELPYVHATNGEIDGTLLSIRTWPEMEPVDAVVTVEPDGANDSIARLAPTAPLGARWYAIRCAGGAPADVTLGEGAPLADGSYVWRFFGVPFPPEVVRIFQASGEEPRSDLQVEFSIFVEPVQGLTPADVATVSQGAVACSPWIAGDSIGNMLYLHCSPALDWDAPFRIQLQGLESVSHGDPLVPIDLTLGGVPGSPREVVLPSMHPAPPGVPPALCAGVDCA